MRKIDFCWTSKIKFVNVASWGDAMAGGTEHFEPLTGRKLLSATDEFEIESNLSKLITGKKS